MQYCNLTPQHQQAHLLHDIRDVNIRVTAHNTIASYYTNIGTLIIPHNGQQIQHPECMDYPKYSHIISRLKTNKTSGILVQEGATYKLNIDEQGGMWIKLEQGIEK